MLGMRSGILVGLAAAFLFVLPFHVPLSHYYCKLGEFELRSFQSIKNTSATPALIRVSMYPLLRAKRRYPSSSTFLSLWLVIPITEIYGFSDRKPTK